MNAARSAVLGGASAPLPFRVLLTSYELLLRDMDFLTTFSFDLAIFDEAHRLKNPQSQLYQAVMGTLHTQRRLLLTGTPVQNSEEEMAALLSVALPDAFSPGAGAIEEFCASPGASAALTAALPHTVLRRMQADVAMTLPPLTQVLLPCPLTPLQRALYLSVLHRNIRSLVPEASGGAPAHIGLANVLTLLQTVCNHPYLLDGVEPEPFEEGAHLVHASAKLDMLDRLLARLLPAGHKVLVFSHFTRTLDVLQDFCALRGISYERLDGSVRGEERWMAIQRFQGKGARAAGPSLFLLSTRAGGQGVTLTQADTVVLFDSGMNPQWDEQAIKRAHRYGQTKPVLVLRLLCSGTAEEVILARGVKKLRMAATVLQGAASTGRAAEAEGGVEEAPPSRGDLLSAIHCGAQTLLGTQAASPPVPPEELPLDMRKPTASSLHTSEEALAGVLGKRGGASEGSEGAQAGADGAAPTDHVYYFDGRDVSETAKAAASAADEQAFTSWATEQLANGSAAVSRQRTTTNSQHQGGVTEEDIEAAEEAAAAAAAQRRWARWQATLRRWDKTGYESAALRKERPVPPPASPGEGGDAEEGSEQFPAPEEWPSVPSFTFTSGNVARPDLSTAEGDPPPHATDIILHCVDASGRWCKGGVFSALGSRCADLAPAYAAAARAGDLKVGDAHLLPYTPAQAPAGEPAQAVALLVCVQRKRGRQGDAGSVQLSLPALDSALEKLSAAIRTTGAEPGSIRVHTARIGSRMRGTSYYAVERYLRKHLLAKGIPTTVYYFSRRSARGGGDGTYADAFAAADAAGRRLRGLMQAPPPSKHRRLSPQAHVPAGSEEEEEEDPTPGPSPRDAGVAGAPVQGAASPPVAVPEADLATRRQGAQGQARPGGAAAATGAGLSSAWGMPAKPQAEFSQSDVEWWVWEAAREGAQAVFPRFPDNISHVWAQASGPPSQQREVFQAMSEMREAAAAAAASGQSTRARVFALFHRIMRHVLALRGAAKP